MLYACVSTGFKPYVIRMTTRVCPTDTMHELTEDTHTKKNTQILNTSDGRLISSFVTVPTNIANIYIYLASSSGRSYLYSAFCNDFS